MQHLEADCSLIFRFLFLDMFNRGIFNTVRWVAIFVCNKPSIKMEKVYQVFTAVESANVWLYVILGFIVLIALSRILSLQKSIADIQSKPVVDEHLVRTIVRQHLEETVKAMDQHNKLQLQMRQQQLQEQMRLAAKAKEAETQPEAKPEPQPEAKPEAQPEEAKEEVINVELVEKDAPPKKEKKRKA